MSFRMLRILWSRIVRRPCLPERVGTAHPPESLDRLRAVKSTASTPDEYLAEQPVERREALAAVRATVNSHLSPGLVEAMDFGMITWQIPLARYPKTYNGHPLGIAALANQKNYMALHLPGLYVDPDEDAWFRERWAASGKKLDMGKGCVRFKRLDDLPLDVVGEAIGRTSVDRYIARYEAGRRR